MLVEYVNLPVSGKATITESEWRKFCADFQASSDQPKAISGKATAWQKAFRKVQSKWEGPNCFWILDSPAQTIAALRDIWSGKLDDQAIVRQAVDYRKAMQADDYRKAQELRAAGKNAEAEKLEEKIIEEHNATEISQRLRLGERQPWEWAMLHPEESLDGPPIHVNLDAGTVVLLPRTVDEALWIALLQNYKKLAICENKNCQHPYFLRYRPRQIYCSEKCALPSQREFKKRWWDEHGKQWRAKQTA
jgi:hypothetical protein